MIVRPNKVGAIPEVKPSGKWGKADCKAGDNFVTRTSRSWKKITPNIGPMVVPVPPMIIMPM